MIFGGLLLLSVVVPNAGEIYRRVRGRVRRVEHSGERRGRLMRLPRAAAASSQREAEVDARVRIHRPGGIGQQQWRRGTVKFHRIRRARGRSSASRSVSACRWWQSPSRPPVTDIKKGLLVYAIPKDTTNPYEVIADNGIKTADQRARRQGGGEQRHARTPPPRRSRRSRRPSRPTPTRSSSPETTRRRSAPTWPRLRRQASPWSPSTRTSPARTTCSSTRPTPSRSAPVRSTCSARRSATRARSRSSPPSRPRRTRTPGSST